jgi:Cof subfamily protein (haloacid dehalogenase superfamily)
MIGLICIDVDGTLVGSGGQVDPAVWEAAAKARAKGQRLAITSGRPAFGLALDYARRLDPQGWHIFQSGASVVQVGDGRSRSVRLRAGQVAALVERARREAKPLEVYRDFDYRAERADPILVRHAALLGVPFVTGDLLTTLHQAVRVQWVIPDGDRERFLDLGPELSVSSAPSPVMPGVSFLSVTAKGVGKAAAITRLAADLGLGLEQVMMVGDGQNDLESVALVGHGVAMGNAEPEVKAAARHLVRDVDAGGLAEAIALSWGL